MSDAIRSPDDQVKQTGIQALFANMRDSAISLTLFPLVASYGLWGETEHGRIIAWLTVAELVALSRWLLYLKRRYAAGPTLTRTVRLAMLSALASGLLWGSSAPLFLSTANPSAALILNVIAVGLAAGSSVASNYWLPSFFLFTVPNLTLYGLYYLWQGNASSFLLALLFFVYMAMLTNLARYMNRSFRDNLLLRLKNEALVEELQREKEAAEAAATAKTRFLAAASHDLRQPVHSLSLFSAVLKDEVHSDQGRELLGHMGSAVNALDQLLTSLLDISKLDAGVVQPARQVIALRPLLVELYRENSALAADKGLDLRLRSCSAQTWTDPVLLANILRNLIRNAIRYTDTGGLLIACRWHKEQIRIQVWDTGIGIPEAEQEQVFTEFHQLHNPERDRNKGLGLGLSICRRLSHLLGHKLSLQSRPGRGSVFTLELRGTEAGTSVAQNPQPDRAAIHDLRGRRILVVDDELSVRQGMAALLKGWGCEVLLADDQDSALAAAQSVDFQLDAVVADYRLRENRTGAEVIATLETRAGTALPALVITGDTHPQRIQEARDSGHTLLHKPVQPGQLRVALARLSA